MNQVADAKARAREHNKKTALELLGIIESDEVITSLGALTISKGDFVRLNKGLFEDFYTIGRIIGIGITFLY